MGLLKDWRYEYESERLDRKVFHFFSLFAWLRLYKWRRQRADRGWSDRDTWGAGEYIAQITAEMLQHLNENKYTDWPEWFKLNVQEEGKGAYTSLAQVISDITTYLDFEKTSWGDGLTTKRDSLEEIFEKKADGSYLYKGPDWYDEKGEKMSDIAVDRRVKKWHKEQIRLHKKAQKAMQFFARHFAQFWD